MVHFSTSHLWFVSKLFLLVFVCLLFGGNNYEFFHCIVYWFLYRPKIMDMHGLWSHLVDFLLGSQVLAYIKCSITLFVHLPYLLYCNIGKFYCSSNCEKCNQRWSLSFFYGTWRVGMTSWLSDETKLEVKMFAFVWICLWLFAFVLSFCV